MKIFLSWSGTRSEKVAKALKDWISTLIQAVEPFMSSEDIGKGTRPGLAISDNLEGSKVGIICLTRENLDANWILFEAGALSKTKDANVCTFLLDLTPSDVKPPLGDFQHTQFNKGDIKQLAHDINKAVDKASEKSLGETKLNEMFNMLWPDIEKKIKEIKKKSPESVQPRRDEREILEEILEIVRAQERRGQLKSGDKVPSDWLSTGIPYRPTIPPHRPKSV